MSLLGDIIYNLETTMKHWTSGDVPYDPRDEPNVRLTIRFYRVHQGEKKGASSKHSLFFQSSGRSSHLPAQGRSKLVKSQRPMGKMNDVLLNKNVGFRTYLTASLIVVKLIV